MRLCLALALANWMSLASDLSVTVTPRATVVERDGITGGGYPVVAGDRAMIFYPNHPDDFGGSVGTASALSADGGLTWTPGADDWPIPGMVDVWADPLRNGDWLAFGIRWVPDPKKRGEITSKDVPADAFQIALSKDGGRTWGAAPAVITFPPELGVIARPLPHILERADGTLLMPAYAWGRSGNRAVLLRSEDRGRRWSLLSVITTAAAMAKTGASVTTPWLETTVSPTADGHLLAVVRTGSSSQSMLVSVRSTDGGGTWMPPEKLSLAGKLPTLHLLPGGVLALLTAHSKNHCRLYFSADGKGRAWSQGHIITSLSGGNAGMALAGGGSLLISTPANRRLDAWRVHIHPALKAAPGLAAPSNIAMAKGTLTWDAAPGAAAYRLTPMLVQPGRAYPEAAVLPHATIETASTKLELARQLLTGSVYAFEIASVDREGRVSAAARSMEMTW